MNPILGGAILSGATSLLGGLLGGNSQKKAAYKQMAAQAEQESKQIINERQNITIQNKYSTAFAQMQLAMQKKEFAKQWGAVSAAKLAADGDAKVGIAATGTMGASAQAIIGDINMKANEATAQVFQNLDMAEQDYNYQLEMMVLNTKLGQPMPSDFKYVGASTGSIIGTSLISGISSFASTYANSTIRSGMLGVQNGRP